jgi:transposase-like protein
VRTASVFAPLNTCSGAKFQRFRTRCCEWTRTQRIRTAAAIPVTVPVVDAGSTPVHLAIAAKAAQLRGLGLSDRRIAQAIGVSDKTVAKSLQRFRIEESLGTLDEAEGPQGD